MFNNFVSKIVLFIRKGTE